MIEVLQRMSSSKEPKIGALIYDALAASTNLGAYICLGDSNELLIFNVWI